MFEREVRQQDLCSQINHVVLADQFPLRIRPFPFGCERSFEVAIGLAATTVVCLEPRRLIQRELPCFIG